jgi:hypothetical protein
MDFIKLKLVEYGMAFVVAPLAVIIVQYLKKYSAWVESRAAWEKRVLVAATVLVFTALGHALGVNFGVNGDNLDFLANVNQATIETVLGSATAFLIHALKKASKK